MDALARGHVPQLDCMIERARDDVISFEKLRLTISAVWPSSVERKPPVSTSHSFAVLSMLLVATTEDDGSKLRQTISVAWP